MLINIDNYAVLLQRDNFIYVILAEYKRRRRYILYGLATIIS